MCLLSCVTEKGKALCFAGVPDSMTKTLNAGAWLKAALAVLGGKGGGKPNYAQGQGPNVDKLSDAISVAKEFAEMNLSK